MMRRVYTDVSDFRSPYRQVPFAGLGALDTAKMWPQAWPAGRSYIDVAQHRMPYRSGYYQNNSLFGLGDEAVVTYAPLFFGAAAGALGMWLLKR